MAALRAARPARRALPGLDLVICSAPYEGVPRQLVAALKFGPRPALAELAAATIARAFDVQSQEGALVAVPPNPRRLRRRGFDPAAEIASCLASELDLPLDSCLGRKAGPRQVGRPRSERLAAPPPVTCTAPPSRALLVDDVLTTGATLAACARALREAGCREVVALCFAFAVPGRPPRGPLGPSRSDA